MRRIKTDVDPKHVYWSMDLTKAISEAAIAHHKQEDKSGAPYIFHCLRVMMAQETEDAMIVGVLHDAVEDTVLSFSSLKNLGASEIVLDALKLVTRPAEDKGTYLDYVRRIRDSKNEIAIAVKLADNADNNDPIRNAKLDPELAAFYKKRYGNARKILLGEIQ